MEIHLLSSYHIHSINQHCYFEIIGGRATWILGGEWTRTMEGGGWRGDLDL